MLARYTLEIMRLLWLRPETKFESWLKVELVWLRARVTLGLLAEDAYEAIKAHAKINVARIHEFEAQFDHDMIAFCEDVRASLVEAGVGQYKDEFHKETTSYDIEDPALVLVLREAFMYIRDDLVALRTTLKKKAAEHKWSFMIHRTHGQSAEPGTFGQLLLVFAQSIDRSIQRLHHVITDELSQGKMSGAVGTYAGMDPRLEKLALAELGLEPALAETQILQRDRHAAALAVLMITAASIEQMCRTFWEMMRSDVGELMEPRKAKQRGSSAMPHKRNPILTERLMGMARLLRAASGAAMENIATPEGRDISQSSVERHILPDATGIVHYMVNRATGLVAGLHVFHERMRDNLENQTQGVWASKQVRNALMDTGVDYNMAYEYTQAAAFEAVDTRTSYLAVVSRKSISPTLGKTAADIIGIAALEKCFDIEVYLKEGIEYIFRRAG